ncbi:MAG: hypothetical protein ACLP1Y_11855 [Candidatus Acidiferrales bacterium]
MFALALCLPLISAEPPSLDAQSASTSTQSATPDTDAAARAAARKRKFEQDEKRLEEGGNDLEAPAPDPQQTLFVSPAIVAMLNGEEHSFMVFDIEGHDLTAKAKWSLSNSNIADLATDGVPTVKAKAFGTVTLRARVGTEEGTSELKVYEGSSLPMGTVRWQAPKIPGFSTQKMTPAVPTANGPDIYVTETNAAGQVLLRAFLADGRQLWMRRVH